MKGFKTLTFNVLASIVPILEMTEVRDVIPDEYLPFYALGMALVNMFLRYLTTTPMGEKS